MILMTGDALSGQRRDAESLLNSFVSAIFIATSRLSDNQMAARIPLAAGRTWAGFLRAAGARISQVTVGGGRE